MLSKFSVKKPYTVVVAVIMVLILGTISFINLETDLLPSMDLPYLVIMTTYPGASPEEVELVVTRPIEQVVATTSNIKDINSISSENSSLVIMEFNNNVNMDSVIIEINSNLDLIKGAWNDSIGNPMIIRINPDMLPVMISAVDMKDVDIAQVSRIAEEQIIPELESVEGVASVTGVGLLEEKIQVTISPEKIDKLNKNILANIDSKLSEVEDKLLVARKEIEEGKTKLVLEEEKQRGKLIEGEKAIAQGKEEIEKGEIELNTAFEELNKNKEEIHKGLVEINKKEEELKKLERMLLNLGENVSQEDKIKLISIGEGLKEITEQKLKLESSAKIIEAKIEEVEKGQLIFNEQKEELKLKEKELAQGKEILSTEMSKAREELINGEKSIISKLNELEKSKEEAFKNASLDGVISIDMISGILKAQNFSMPAGYIDEDGTDYLVKVGDKIKDIQEMKNLLLFDTGEESIGKIFLRDVADVGYVDNSKDIYAKVNGNNAVILNFQKQSNFSTAEVAKNIRNKMEELSTNTKDLSFSNLMDQGIYIDIVVKSVLKNIIYGGILAILILILFLKDVKPTFVIAVSIPISIIFAIAMMYFTKVTINIISLAGLALGVGMLVDNSIVVIENIYRLRNEGMESIDAAVQGAREVSGAIIASTITTACVFLPIIFTKGISRQIFTDMGLTIAYSLFASLIVALSLVPAMASSILKNTKEKESKVLDKFLDYYEGILTWTLKHKGIVMLFVTVLLAFSGYFAYSKGTSFMPEMEAPQMSLSIEMPKGSTFADTIQMSDNVIERIMDIEEIQTIGALQSQDIGGFASGDSNKNTMSIYLLLDENKKISNSEIEDKIKELTRDLEAKISINTANMDMTALGGSGIEVLIKGRNLDGLKDIAKEISEILKETEGTNDVLIGINTDATETRIQVDKEKAMENGLTVAQIFGEINTLLSKGKSSTTLTVSNRDYPIIVLDRHKEELSRKVLENIEINLNEDKEEEGVKLGDIATISEVQGLSSIRRRSQERYISVTAAIEQDYNIGLVSREFENKLKDYKLPEGYSIELSGENEMIKDSLRDLIYMLLLAIAFIYLIMVAQFQSLLSPFIVMFTIPLAFTGGLLALIITGNNISLIAMLGFLVLSGIVVNNGIVFVDYTNQLREKGLEKKEALILAGRTRIRPIFMTAITTILGLSTLSAGLGMGSEALQPLAIVAIGGLIYATLLTLLVVPAMYDLFHKE